MSLLQVNTCKSDTKDYIILENNIYGSKYYKQIFISIPYCKKTILPLKLCFIICVKFPSVNHYSKPRSYFQRYLCIAVLIKFVLSYIKIIAEFIFLSNKRASRYS